LAIVLREDKIEDFVEIPKLWRQNDASAGECAMNDMVMPLLYLKSEKNV
jgi:hypothetical protein